MTRAGHDCPLDHAGILGSDIDVMVTAFREIGFVVSDPQELMGRDPGGEPIGLGQWSAHVLFVDSYIELTAVPERSPQHHLARYFELGDGPRLILFATGDAKAEQSRLAGARTHDVPLRPHEVQRASRTDARTGEEARFSWFGLDADAFPEALVAFVEHRTPELVFRAPRGGHPNAARRVSKE